MSKPSSVEAVEAMTETQDPVAEGEIIPFVDDNQEDPS